jgi:acyl carrier protein
VPLTEFPRTPNGKIDKNALPEPEIGKAKDFIAPRTSIETKMVELWSEVLNIDKEKISINENFFDLGGNSLKIVQLNSMLIDMFNVDIPTVELFRNSTIASFLDYISRDKNKPVSNGVKEEKLEEVRESLHDALTIFGEQ